MTFDVKIKGNALKYLKCLDDKKKARIKEVSSILVKEPKIPAFFIPCFFRIGLTMERMSSVDEMVFIPIIISEFKG